MQEHIVEVVDRQFVAYNLKNAEMWASTYAEGAIQQTTDGVILAKGRAEIQEKFLPVSRSLT